MDILLRYKTALAMLSFTQLSQAMQKQYKGQEGVVIPNVDYPDDLREIVKKAVVSWKTFCQLPREEKCAFSFLEDNHGDGAGYELKEEIGSKKDLKENFQITLFQCSWKAMPVEEKQTVIIPAIQPQFWSNGSMQTHDIGFNYHLSHKECANLFFKIWKLT